jgi:hypothetical protein
LIRPATHRLRIAPPGDMKRLYSDSDESCVRKLDTRRPSRTPIGRIEIVEPSANWIVLAGRSSIADRSGRGAETSRHQMWRCHLGEHAKTC